MWDGPAIERRGWVEYDVLGVQLAQWANINMDGAFDYELVMDF